LGFIFFEKFAVCVHVSWNFIHSVCWTSNEKGVNHPRYIALETIRLQGIDLTKALFLRFFRMAYELKKQSTRILK